ncbi:MAG TPA: hypothetical protein VIG93_09840 [Gaiellaceae bacterium]
MASRPVPRSVAVAVGALVLGTAAAMTWYGLALAGDGSYYLVRVLGTEAVFGPDFRVLVNVVRQAPVLAVAAAGVTDTHPLTLVHGVGQLIIPAFVWSAAILLTRADRLAFSAVTMTTALCVTSTWFFNVSESVLAVPLTVLVAVLLWQPREWRRGEVALAATASIVLVASYETTLLTGIILATWGALRARRETTRRGRYATAFVAGASILSVLGAVAGINAGPGPTNAQSFMYFVLSVEPRPFYLALAGIAALVAAWAYAPPGAVRRALLAAGAVAVGAGVVATDQTTTAAFEARGGASIAGLLVALFLFSEWLVRHRRPAQERRSVAVPDWFLLVPVAMTAVVCIANVAESRSWSRSLDAFRAEVSHAEGITSASDVLPANRQAVLWDWTASSLSLIVRPSADAGVLVDRQPSYVPFPPAAAREQLDDTYVWRR